MNRDRLIRIALLLAASVVPFARALPNPWLWDDRQVLGRRLAPAHCSGLGDVWRRPYWGVDSGPRDTYRPVSLSLIYLERQAFGESATPYHVISLGLHATVGLLIWWVLGRLAAPGVGFATALLFAAHPVHAEAVAMVYGQLELVAAIFVLLAVGLYERSRRDGVRPGPFALAVACAACAAGSKESALMLPALLMLVRSCGMVEGPVDRDWWRRFARGLGWDSLFLLATVPYLMLRFEALGDLAPDPEATIASHYGPGRRIKLVVVSIGHALRLCVVPTGQGLYYGHLRDSISGLPYEELMWIGVAAAVGYRLASELGRRPAFFGIGWFLLAFFPVSNLVPTGVMVAERTLYLPSLGACFLAASLLDRLAADGSITRRAARGALAGLVAAGIIASTLVVGHWRDEETLWRTTTRSHPRSPLAQLLLGQAMLDRWSRSAIEPPPRELGEASAAFEAAYTLNPSLTHALVGRAWIAVRRGDREKAAGLLREARRRAPDDPAVRDAFRQVVGDDEPVDLETRAEP